MTSSEPKIVRFAEAADEALAEEMRHDERIFVMGTNLSAHLSDEFGPERVRITPISEALLTGMAVGAAADGMRPVVNWRNANFSFTAFDQIANQAAKLRYMSGGQRALPIVFRCYGGGGLRMAAQHSTLPHAIFAHVGGLKVAMPATASDAYGLMRAAIQDDNPVVVFEASVLDQTQAELPGEDHFVPLGKAAILRSGDDVTVVAICTMVHTALAAADEVAGDGLSVEVIDLRSVVPMDLDVVLNSVRRTGRLVVVDEAPAMCSATSELAAAVAEDAAALAALRAPVRRVTNAPVPIPFAAQLEDAVRPSAVKLISAIRATVRSPGLGRHDHSFAMTAPDMNSPGKDWFPQHPYPGSNPP